MATATSEPPRAGHIFVSYAGADVQAARQFAEILRRDGLDLWFDKDKLQPREPRMATLEEAISRASAMIVYIGRLAVQAWACAQHARSSRLIPVLGEGADLRRFSKPQADASASVGKWRLLLNRKGIRLALISFGVAENRLLLTRPFAKCLQGLAHRSRRTNATWIALLAGQSRQGENYYGPAGGTGTWQWTAVLPGCIRIAGQ